MACLCLLWGAVLFREREKIEELLGIDSGSEILNQKERKK
jgi:hypothetical protein